MSSKYLGVLPDIVGHIPYRIHRMAKLMTVHRTLRLISMKRPTCLLHQRMSTTLIQTLTILACQTRSSSIKRNHLM